MTDRAAPRISRLALTGVVVIGVGLVEAIVGAVAAPAMAMPHHEPANEHLLAFIGMVMVLIGVLKGARPAPRPVTDRVRHQEDRNAIR